MTASKHPQYKSRYPEQFNWSMLGSPKLSSVAQSIATLITREFSLSPADRFNVPGLRLALNTLASQAEI